MCADPEPNDAALRVEAEGTIVQTHATGPEASDPLEVQRWMARIVLEKLEFLISKTTNQIR